MTIDQTGYSYLAMKHSSQNGASPWRMFGGLKLKPNEQALLNEISKCNNVKDVASTIRKSKHRGDYSKNIDTNLEQDISNHLALSTQEKDTMNKQAHFNLGFIKQAMAYGYTEKQATDYLGESVGWLKDHYDQLHDHVIPKAVDTVKSIGHNVSNEVNNFQQRQQDIYRQANPQK